MYSIVQFITVRRSSSSRRGISSGQASSWVVSPPGAFFGCGQLLRSQSGKADQSLGR